MHPGAIQTELQRHYSKEIDEAFIRQNIEANAKKGPPPFKWKTMPQGAVTNLWAAAVAASRNDARKYGKDSHVAEINNSEGVINCVRSYALEPRKAKALWEKIEGLVNETF